MAFTDYIDLQTAVIEHVSNPTIADVMPRLVKLAEAAFNNRLRCREMMTTAAITVTGGVAPLPADFIDAIGLFSASGREYIEQPVHMVIEGRNNGFYAISGDTLLVNSDGVLSLRYNAKIPSLTTGMTASNWLLQRFPALYLYGVAYEAAKYLRDLELAQATKGLLEMEFTDAYAADERTRYSRARIILPGVTP